MQTLLKKYIRNENRQPVGVIVANQNGVGWSMCGPRDRWNDRIGMKIAVNRANFKDEKREIGVPIDIAHEFYAMEERRKRYFKL